MTRTLNFVRDRKVAIIHSSLAAALPSPAELGAAHIGLLDGRGLMARLRHFIATRPRLLLWAKRVFGMKAQTSLADERLEAIRLFALDQSLAGRQLSAHEAVRGWRVARA